MRHTGLNLTEIPNETNSKGIMPCGMCTKNASFPSAHFGSKDRFNSNPMATLDGVVAEWDNDPVVRERLRENRKLFVPAPFMEKPQAKVECGEYNYEVLKPLAKRLLSPDGTVGMHAVPHIQHQIFSSN